MRKLFFVLASIGIAGAAVAQAPARPVNIPGTYLGESDGPVKNINCQASEGVCCVIWISTRAGQLNSVTANGKTYTFTTYTTKTDPKGNTTLTFQDTKPKLDDKR